MPRKQLHAETLVIDRQFVEAARASMVAARAAAKHEESLWTLLCGYLRVIGREDLLVPLPSPPVAEETK